MIDIPTKTPKQKLVTSALDITFPQLIVSLTSLSNIFISPVIFSKLPQ